MRCGRGVDIDTQLLGTAPPTEFGGRRPQQPGLSATDGPFKASPSGSHESEADNFAAWDGRKSHSEAFQKEPAHDREKSLRLVQPWIVPGRLDDPQLCLRQGGYEILSTGAARVGLLAIEDEHRNL